VRVCTLHPEALAAAENWLDQQRRQWNRRLDRLDALALTLSKETKDDP
jgi:hypothetical protein